MAETTYPHLERARTITEEERRWTMDELEALTSFLDRVSDLEVPVPSDSTGVDAHKRALTVDVTSPPISDKIETAYRETMMDVPHYDEVYGRSYEADLLEEFGEDIAFLLTNADTVAPSHLRLLRSATQQSIEERREFVAVLDRELKSLRECSDRLREIELAAEELGETPTGETADADDQTVPERLIELEAACEDLAKQRQETLHSRRSSTIEGIDAGSLVGYLYLELDERCPAIVDILAVLESIQRQRQRLESRRDGSGGGKEREPSIACGQ